MHLILSSTADWEGSGVTLADLEIVNGRLRVAAGHSQGTVNVVAEDPAWTGWQEIILRGNVGPGAGIYFRYRCATTEGGLAAATWSEYLDNMGLDGTLAFGAGAYALNHASTHNVGPWIEIQVLLQDAVAA
jgi:hypothetical protein